MTKLTKSERAARLDTFLSNDDNFVVVSRAEYEASPQYAASCRYQAAKGKRVAARKSEEAATTAAIVIGQRVKVAGKVVFGDVAAVDGNVVTVTVTESQFIKHPVGATVRFAASFIQAA